MILIFIFGHLVGFYIQGIMHLKEIIGGEIFMDFQTNNVLKS